MKFNSPIRPRLRWPVTMLAIATLAALFLVAAGMRQSAAARERLQAAQEHLAARQKELQAAHAEKARSEENIGIVRQWRARGLFEKEDRRAWAAALQRMANGLGIADLRLRFSASQAFGSAPPRGMHWQVTTLHLSMPDIDEERLLRFLQDIDSAMPVESILRRCDLKLDDDTEESPRSLAVDCTLDWLTLRPAEEAT